MVRPLLKEARNRLARSSVCFEQAYQEGEFSLAGERLRELYKETAMWLREYGEEVLNPDEG